MEQQSFKYQLLADLLATLEAAEFPIGIGKHLNLQQLISKFPEDISPEEMKTLLCPLFAKSKQDQAYFYEIFDQSLNRVKAKTWKPKDESTFKAQEKVNPYEKWVKLIVGLLLLSLAVFIYIRSSGNQPLKMPEPYWHTIIVEEGNSAEFALTDLYDNKVPTFLDSTMKIQYVSFADGQNLKSEPEFGNYQIDSNGIFSIQVLDSVSIQNKVDTIFAKYEIGIDTTILNINILEETIEEPEKEEAKTDTLVLREHPSPKSLSQLFPQQEPYWMTWFDHNKIWFKPLLTILLLALLGLWSNWRRDRDQRIIADIQSKDDPPLLWNIKVPNVGKLGLNEDYFKVLHQMRQRTNDDYVVLDIPKTVKKTVEQGGVIDFQYAYKTRPPEYLLLIDRQNSKNHRALFYNFIYESFKADEVFIERFFYEGDIRLCWNENFPNGIKLQDLQQSHRDARLIIVGNGFQLLNPRNGKLAKWTRLFDAWRDKAILSPKPTKDWGGRERQLEEKFILLPASVQSLTLMVDKMEAVDPDEIKTKLTDEIVEPIEFQGDLIATLHHYFSIKKDGKIVDDRMVQWIAACAIYPSLHWDLTMYLGKELSDEDSNLLTLDHVLQLTRLPWFVEGKLPEQVRLELLEYLPEATELKLRESLQQLFETVAMPAENSVAHSDARMNIALNDYLLKKDNHLKKEYEQYLEAGTEADVTMLKYLEGEKSPKDFEIDNKWRKYAQGEKPSKEMTPLEFFMGFLCMFLIGLLWWYSPSFNGCEGELIEYKDLELCIKDKRERLIYREFQVRDLIEKGGYDKADSLVYQSLVEFSNNTNVNNILNVNRNDNLQNSIDDLIKNKIPELSSDTSIVHFNNNISVDYYNQGVPYYNRFLKVQDDSFLGDEERIVLKNTFCKPFDLAIFYAGQGDYLEKYKDIILINFNNCEAKIDIPEKELPKQISGTVLDRNTRKSLENVDVTLFSQKVKTDENGQFTLEISNNIPNVGDRNVTISFTKKDYQKYSKTYGAINWMVGKDEIDKPFDIGKVYLSGVEFQQPNPNAPVTNNTDTFCSDALDILKGFGTVIKNTDNEEDLLSTIEAAYERIGFVNDCNPQGEDLIVFEESKKAIFKEIEKKNRLLDIRDGQVYNTVNIGKQTWMAENLKFKTSQSKCYDDKNSNCESYGKLYNVNNTNNLCPSGWRVPGYEDFEYLIQSYGVAEDNDLRKYPDKILLQKAFDSLMPEGVSGFNWQLGGAVRGNRFAGLGEGSYYLTTSTRLRQGVNRNISYIVNETFKGKAIYKIDLDPADTYFGSCRCVRGPLPNATDFPQQQQQQQERKMVTLIINPINIISGDYQPGYTMVIEKQDGNSIEIQENPKSKNFQAEVEAGKYITLKAMAKGEVKTTQYIAPIDNGDGTYKINIRVGLPISNDNLSGKILIQNKVDSLLNGYLSSLASFEGILKNYPTLTFSNTLRPFVKTSTNDLNEQYLLISKNSDKIINDISQNWNDVRLTDEATKLFKGDLVSSHKEIMSIQNSIDKLYGKSSLLSRKKEESVVKKINQLKRVINISRNKLQRSKANLQRNLSAKK